jgi:hypothetical protein
MKPVTTLTVTDRYKLKEFALKQLMTVPAGRVMYCRGRKILGYADVADLAQIFGIPRGTTEICVSSADFADIKEWIG